MILNNVTIINGASPVSIQIINGEMTPADKGLIIDTLQLTFDNALVFPGLINAHDHLDFNLFPSLGNKTYNNYTEWGSHLHKDHKKEIDAVLKVPLDLRVRWGMFKNLLCGVTTVVNHGEWLNINDPIINVEQERCLHSVHFEKKWKLKLNNPFKKNLPVMIHTGEGKDEQASREIDNLIRWNLLRKKLIGIHGVAMSEDQAKKFEALVWCPGSNYFLLNQTAEIDHLKRHTTILFGTDSTLTSDWNIWNHIRLARKTKLLTDSELYNAVSINAVNIFKKSNPIEAGAVVVKIKGKETPFESFFATDPADILLIVRNNTIQLFDEALREQLTSVDIRGFSRIYINGACKYVKGNLPGLIKKIKEYYPQADFPITTDAADLVTL